MMKIITLILFFSSPSILAVELIRVENLANNSCTEPGCIHYEWKLKGDESIRFVISGYHDSSDCRFYKISEGGQYSVILDISPIIVDSNGKYWWGYAWDIEDIPIEYKNGKIFVQATFEHNQIRDGNFIPPKWQYRFPVVKFYGKKTRWNLEQPKYNYKMVSLEALSVAAKQITNDVKLM